MATSGTATFNLDFGEVAEEAFERCGLELRSGYDLRTARRSLNLLTLEWSNRGVNLWTIEEATQVLTADDGEYNLPADTIDVLPEPLIRTGSGSTQSDRTIEKIGALQYQRIPNKTKTGPPLQVWIDRQQAQPVATFWPVPDSATTYTFVYMKIRRIQDTGSGGTYNPDVPARFLPALVAGLAWRIAEKRQPQRMMDLKAAYEEAWDTAAGEDSEKQPIRIIPGGLK